MGRTVDDGERDAGRERSERKVDEAVWESFPASDPPSSWSGEDRRDLERSDPPVGGAPDVAGELPVPDSVPEADDPAVVEGWDRDDGMEGPSPTG